jgi:exopolysaccharide production protein ExoQ
VSFLPAGTRGNGSENPLRWVEPRRASSAEPRHASAAASWDLMGWLAFGLSVFLLLIYSDGWLGPLTGDKPGLENAALIRAAYYPAYAATAVVLISAWRDGLRALIRSPLLILFVGLAAASVLWSVDPAATTRRSVAVIVTSLGGLTLAARFDWTRLAQVMATTFAVLAVLSLIVCVALPSIGRMTELFPGAWRGLWLEKNTFGGFMAVAFVVFAATALLDRPRWWLWSGFAVLAVGLVIGSTSKTSLVALALGMAALSFVWLARRGPVVGVLMVWLAVVLIGVTACIVIFEPQWIFHLLDKDATLTGRTKIWAGAIREIRTRPWLGFGYGAIWDNKGAWGPLARITDEAGFEAHHAHSSWVEMALNLGLVGLGLWALWFLETAIRGLVSIFTSRGAYLAVPLLAVYALTSLTESITLTWNDVRWVMFCAIAVKLALGERRPPREAVLRGRPAMGWR